MFLQLDWWEVAEPGVGTNRYVYSFNDPVNGRDVSGHCPMCLALAVGCAEGGCEAAIAGALGIGLAETASDKLNDGKVNGNGALAATGKAAADLLSKTVAGPGHNGDPSLEDDQSNGNP
ncbi:MAG: hypothetical protein U1E48_08405 [Paracoccaceae bacterium]